MKSSKEQLLEKIEDKSLQVGIIGLGYVGIPLLLSFVAAGYHVVGFDIDPEKVKMMNDGQSYIKHLDGGRVKQARDSGLFEATADFSRTGAVDTLIMCVPTPLDRHDDPDISYITSTVEEFLPYLRAGQIVSLESTTYPGTTDEVIKPRLESKGLKVGEDIFLVYSPEREDPGNKNFSTSTTPKVVGGVTPNCLEVGRALYSKAIQQVVPVSSARAAELTKLLENIYRAVNIGLINEMKMVADRMGIDIWEVISAASTKPFGFTPFYPGPGWGGHCIPIDPFYLTWKAKEYGLHTHFIELAGEVNNGMPQWVVDKVTSALNDRGKSLKGSKVLVLGIAYKKNIDDMRESPAAKILELLQRKGAVISYADPYIPVFPRMRAHNFDLRSVELTPEVLQTADCVLLVTDHDCFDYEMIRNNSRLIVDTRGRYRGNYKNVVKG